MKSYVDSFLDPTCVPVTIPINILDLVPNRRVAGLFRVLRNGRRLVTGESYITVVSGIELTPWVFLQHLNSQQLLIRFTMEIENDSTVASVDTSVYRKTDGRITTDVYMKPTHTGQA